MFAQNFWPWCITSMIHQAKIRGHGNSPLKSLLRSRLSQPGIYYLSICVRNNATSILTDPWLARGYLWILHFFLSSFLPFFLSSCVLAPFPPPSESSRCIFNRLARNEWNFYPPNVNSIGCSTRAIFFLVIERWASYRHCGCLFTTELLRGIMSNICTIIYL